MLPTLDFEGFGSKTKNHQEENQRDDEQLHGDDHFVIHGDVLDINSQASTYSLTNHADNNIPLAQLYAQREQEMIKALEFGQNLLKRVRYLESELSFEKAEKEEYQKGKGYLEEENDILKHRIENLEGIIDDSRKERNKLQYTCKELGQEIEKLQQEAHEKECFLEKFSQIKEQSIEYKYKIDDLQDEISKLRIIIQKYEEKEKNEDKKVELLRRNSEKNEKTEVDFLKKQINDLQQKMEKYQAERDMAHVQARVRINEVCRNTFKVFLIIFKLKQGIDELQENEMRLKEMLEKKQPPSEIKKAHNCATECSREIRNFRIQFLKDSGSISQCFEELSSVLSGMTGLLSENTSSKNKESDSSLEMSYAILQKKIINELGLDEFFATGGGKKAPQFTKKGWLCITTGYFDNKDKWVKISNSGICIFTDDNEKTLLSCFSLDRATLKISSKNTKIFELVCDIGKSRKKSICVTAKNENERNEWCAFISRILEIIT